MRSGPDQGFVPGRHLVDAYGNGGFRFAEMSHRGSILALPSGIRAWAPRRAADITPESVDPILADAAEIDFVLVGTGLEISAVADAVRRRLSEAGLGIDIMQTGAAARTYNILVAENRKVGAALLAIA